MERLIVIGASTGGVAALRTLFEGFGDGLDASIRDGERREDHRARLATEIEALRKNTEQLRALAGEYLASDAPGH